MCRVGKASKESGVMKISRVSGISRVSRVSRVSSFIPLEFLVCCEIW
jgi:hypothetical protein